MILRELISAVYTETNRPDLVPETLQAIMEATFSIHNMESFYRDILENTIVFTDAGAYIQQLALQAVPRFRSVAYIKKSDPVNNLAEQYNLPLQTNLPPLVFKTTQFNFLRQIDIGDILDGYGYEKTDVWYAAGSQINIKSSTPLHYCTLGWYANPLISIDGSSYESWVATDYPYAIIYKAAGSIFSKIGEEKSLAMYMRPPSPQMGYESGGEFYKQFGLLVRNTIRANG